MSDTIDDETLSHFVAFTGCDDFNLARSFLRASNSNVNTAVEMYFTNPNGPPQQSSSSSLASTFSSAPAQRQTVRGAVTAPPPSEAELSHVNASASASANAGSNVSLHPNSSNQNQSSRDRERERERERARERDKSNKPKNGLFGGLFKKVRTFFGGSHHEESHGQGNNNNNNNDVTTGPRPPQNSRPNNTTTTTSSTASAAPSTTSTTSIQPATLQRLSVSDGRRQALEFAKKFREKYASTTISSSSSSSSSTPSPPWYEDCYTNALYAAREAHRPVFIYLHSPHHADTDDFCERVLCHPGLVDYVSEHFVCWGGDISGTEGGLLASIFDVTTYPYFCIIDQEETPVTTATTSTTAATSSTTTAATEKTANVLLLFSQDGNLVSETIEDLLTRIFLTIDEHRNKEAARLDLEHQRNLREHQNREYEDIIRRDAEIIAQRALEDTERERLVQEREKKVADLLQKEEKIIEELRIKVGKIEECILQRRDFIQDSIVQHDRILMEQEEAKEKYIESEEYKLLCKSKDMCDVVIRLPSGSKLQLQIPRGLELYKLHRMIEVDPSTKAELFDLDIIQRVASIFYPCIVPVGDSDVGEVGNDEDLKNNKDQVIEATTIELEIIKSDILQKIAVLVNKKESSSSSSGSNLENGAEIDTNTNSNSPTTIQDLGLNTTVANGNGDNASNIGNNSNNNNPLNKDDDDDDEAEEFAFLRGGKSATVNGTSSSTSVFRKQQSTLSARTNARQQNNGYNSGPNSASPSPIVKPGSTPTQPSFLRLNSTTSTTSTTSTGTSTLSSPNLSTPIQTNTSSSISLTNEQATIRYEELQSRGFIKKFQLVQPHPRTVYDDITSTFASLKIGRRAMLILEISPMTTITVTSTSTGVSKDTMDDNDNNRDEDNNESKNDKNEQSQIQYKYGHSAFETI